MPRNRKRNRVIADIDALFADRDAIDVGSLTPKDITSLDALSAKFADLITQI